MIGIVGGASRALSPNANAVTSGSGLNSNYDYDFTSDDHIEEEQNIGILNNSNNSNIQVKNDTVNQSVNNSQTNTLEDENLVQKIQQSLENFKKAKTENIAWVTRLQSKKISFMLYYFMC